MTDDESTNTAVAFHAQRLQEAFDAYLSKCEVDPVAVEVDQYDDDDGTQWFATARNPDGTRGNPVLLYSVSFNNPMELN